MSDSLERDQRNRLYRLLPWQLRELIVSATDEFEDAEMRVLQRFALSDEQKRQVLKVFFDSLVMAETAKQLSSRLHSRLNLPFELGDQIAREFERQILAELPSLCRLQLLNHQRDEVMEGRESDIREYERESTFADKAKGRQTLRDYMRRVGVNFPLA